MRLPDPIDSTCAESTSSRYLRMPAWRRILLGAACVGTLVGSGAAQQRFDVRTDVVRLEVSVLDSERRPIEGLTAADFTILEDGEPRPITVFQPVSLPPIPTVTAAWQREVASDVIGNQVPDDGRLVLIAIDRSVGGVDRPLTLAIANQIIDQLGPNDLAAVVFTIEFSNLRSPQNFTADKGLLRDAVARPFAHGAHGEIAGPNRGGCPCGACVMETLAHVAKTVRDVPGRRKQLFFISTQFMAAAGGVFSGKDIVNHRGVVCAFPLRYARAQLILEAGLSNLTIHTLDPGGLKGVNTGHFLTDITGGRPVAGTNAPETFVPAIMDESRSYYLIGFEPAEGGRPNRLRKIEVNVPRPDVRVLARNGYYPDGEPSPRHTATRMPEELTRSLDGVLPASAVPLRIAAAAFATPGDDATVLVTTGVRVEEHDRADAKGAIRAVTAAFDPQGRQVGREVTRTVEIAAQETVGVEMPIQTRLALRPGRYEIRVAVEAEASGARGSVFAFVEAPDVARESLTMSDIVIERATAPSNDEMAALAPILQREFTATDRVTVRVRVFQGGRDALAPVDVSARVVDAHDRVVHETATTLDVTRFSAGRAADHVLPLPVANLSSGEYLLRLEGVEGARRVSRHVRFAVGP